MKKQRYGNHAMYYPAHHFVFYPLVTAGLIFSIRNAIVYDSDSREWVLISALWIMVIWLSLMMRQHYALIGQNRMVRMEMRFRYHLLTGQRLELLETQLGFNRIAALRFASDEELPALVKRAIDENLSPDEIKKSIKHWLADEMRV